MHLQWWKLASDGSYFCAGNGTSLACWSPSGQLLFSKSGNYFNAVAFATPTALLVALGSAGQDVIETVSIASGTSSVGPAFQGKFYAWFVDGTAFLTTAAVTNTVSVYSPASALEDSRSLPSLRNLTGQGNWFWTWPLVGDTQGPVTIYAVGNSALPTAPLTPNASALPGPRGPGNNRWWRRGDS